MFSCSLHSNSSLPSIYSLFIPCLFVMPKRRESVRTHHHTHHHTQKKSKNNQYNDDDKCLKDCSQLESEEIDDAGLYDDAAITDHDGDCNNNDDNDVEVDETQLFYTGSTNKQGERHGRGSLTFDNNRIYYQGHFLNNKKYVQSHIHYSIAIM